LIIGAASVVILDSMLTCRWTIVSARKRMRS